MKTMNYYLGCDISSETFTACLINNSGIELIKSTEFKNTSEGFVGLENTLGKLNLQPKSIILLIESTGVYGEELCYHFSSKSYKVVIEAAQKIKNTIKASPRKNDFIDAERIAEYAYRFVDKLNLWEAPSVILDEIKSLLSLREHLVEQMTANKSALISSNRKHHKSELVQQVYQETIKLGKEQIKTIDKQIKQLIDKDNSFRHKTKLLLTVPGVGLLLASNLMVLTGWLYQGN